MARMESGEGTFQWHQLQLTPTSTEQEVEQVLAHYACWEAGSFQWTCLARDLMRLTGALFLVLSEYCPERKSLITRGIEGIPQKVEAVIHQLGHPVMGYEWVLADGVYETLQEERLHRLDSLHEVSSYHIPEFVGFTIEKLLGIGSIYSMGFLHEGQLLGNFVLAMPKGQTLQSEQQVMVLSRGVGRVLSQAERKKSTNPGNCKNQ